MQTQSGHPPQFDRSHIPPPGPFVFGRDGVRQRLEMAWEDPQKGVVVLEGPAGIGKSTLIADWLQSFTEDDGHGAEAVLAWSFGRHGSRIATSDAFLEHALTLVGEEPQLSGPVYDRGVQLARVLADRRILLILDDVQFLQFRDGPRAGQFKDPALGALLTELTQQNDGLCVAATDVLPAADGVPGASGASHSGTGSLSPYDRTARQAARASGWFQNLISLNPLDSAEGTALLAALRVAGDEAEFRQAVKFVGGHPLSLVLLAGYLKLVWQGDVARWRELRTSSRETSPTECLRNLVSRLDDWLGENSGALALIRVLSLFDRPATLGEVQAVLDGPAIAGLTEPLARAASADADEFVQAVDQLKQAYLLPLETDGGEHSADRFVLHALVQKHVARQLAHNFPAAYQEGHRRLYRHLAVSSDPSPATVGDAVPQYQALAHGCLAGRAGPCLTEFYWKHVLRGGQNPCWKELGAAALDLAGLSCFCSPDWQCDSQTLPPGWQAFVLVQASRHLCELGRLDEAAAATRNGLSSYLNLRDWKNAAVCACNLCEVLLWLGRIDEALHIGRQGVDLADRSDDGFRRQTNRTRLASAMFQSGKPGEAERWFREAEELQRRRRPGQPRLHSKSGALYCDFLLAPVEQAAWENLFQEATADEVTAARTRCDEVHERAVDAWRLAEKFFGKGITAVDVALDHLTLGRTLLYEVMLQADVGAADDPADDVADDIIRTLDLPETADGPDSTMSRPPTRHLLEKAAQHLHHAVAMLRGTNHAEELARTLVYRSELRTVAAVHGESTWAADQSDGTVPDGFTLAEDDCAEARSIAVREQAQLVLVDSWIQSMRLELLRRNRLSLSGSSTIQLIDLRNLLDSARSLATDLGYHRRDRELDVAEHKLREPDLRTNEFDAQTVSIPGLFAQLWSKSARPPDVFAFLQDHPDASAREAADVCLIDQDRRGKSGRPLPVQDYLAGCGTLAEDVPLQLELILADFARQTAGGRPVDVDQYVAQFGALKTTAAEVLRERLARQQGRQNPSESIRHFLSDCESFSALPPEVLAVLAGQTQEESYAAGEFIVRQGDPGTSLMIVREGFVEICADDESGRRYHIGRTGRGQVIGEMALLTNRPRSAHAIALVSTRVLALSAAAFFDLAARYPAISVLLTKLISRRLGSSERDVLAGKTLDRYLIKRNVQRGGMSVVYEAVDTASGRRVALKMMSHRLVYDSAALRRFQREADLIEAMEHENIVHMYGRFEAFRTYFLVLEFCDGETLSSVLRRTGPLPDPVACAVLGQVAKALYHAHRLHIVHRDIKPANIMLNADGTVKLMDFGLARPLAEHAPEIDEAILGTPGFMAPEQMAGKVMGKPVDYFALGCVAFQILTGRPLFSASDVLALRERLLAWPNPSFRELCPDAGDRVALAFERSLYGDPKKRALDLKEVADWAAPVQIDEPD